MSNSLALVIEDHIDSSIIFSEAVKMAGFDVETIRDGEAALKRLAVVKPDVVILDLNLPHVSGMDILRQIRSDPRLADTHVVVVTAHDELINSIQEQADLVLVKPVAFSQIRKLAADIGSLTK
ncbi:MAG: PleD family two-component system response regulator [Anaerolineae bacterium]|jgi:DNA-binding response OmpR family regulator